MLYSVYQILRDFSTNKQKYFIYCCKKRLFILKFIGREEIDDMDYALLGNTGLLISKMGFGGIPIQRTDEAGAVKLMDTIIEAGINYIDTARAYTNSEALIGQALIGRRDRFVIATKSMARTREEMAADIEKSLSELRTDYIDIYQVHNPSLSQLDTVLSPGGAMEALDDAKKSGKIGHIGITAHSVEVFEKALDLGLFETVMFPYNIVETQGTELISRCKHDGVGFIAMKPLAGGAIENGFEAIRFVLSNPAVSVVIPGMCSPHEVRDNCSALSAVIGYDPQKSDYVKKVRAELNENFCRRCNYCAPCTVGIPIPSIFLFEGYLSRYSLEDWARKRYATVKVKAGECIGCGVCETRCPYNLPIREMLKKAAEEFGE